MTTTSPPPAEKFDFAKIRWIYFGLMIGMFTSSISQTIVSPAIPRIISDLGGVEYYSWLSTIVMLVSTIVTPISGKLSDMFGRRRFYIIGLLVFVGGSILSGAAQSFPMLVTSRAIQGVGMGILMPLSQIIIGDIIPARQRGKYQGWMGAMMGASQVAGPLIGGWITDALSWRWLFYINLPVGLVALYMIVRHLRIPELNIPAKVDYAGISTMTIGLTSFLIGISLGGTQGWLNPLVITLIVVGLIVLVVFFLIERKAAEPIIPFGLFGNSIFRWSVIAGFFMSVALMTVLVYTPVYVQGVLGMSATESGLVLIPMNVAVFGMGVMVGNLTTRTGRYKEFAIAGAAIQFVGALLLTRLHLGATHGQVVLATVVVGFGCGMAFQIYTLAVQNAVRRRDLGTATSSLQFFRNIGNTLGTAVAGTMMTAQMASGIERHMTDAARRLIPPGGLNPNAVLNARELAKLPPELADVLRLSLADAMQHVYLLVPIATAVVFCATLMIRPLPLRDTLAGPDDRGREVLESTAMSSPEKDMSLRLRADAHARSKERMLGAHLILLAEQAKIDRNNLLRETISEFGGGDYERGIQVLRSTGMMLLTEDSAVVDEHEAFAIELGKRGRRKDMLSDELTARLERVASHVAEQPVDAPSKPLLESVEGIDSGGIKRAVGMLDSALVADLAVAHWDVPVTPPAPEQPPQG
ncbi:MDR family MFS transporter [Nigerium massiliense]|uniref:MDR family MFS transporter n=1 Tax=Nigerium massiliense TaxID=1522317 RepID=UPI0006941BE3|nr:MDR family MFS transporter [Nigerium massiliense]